MLPNTAIIKKCSPSQRLLFVWPLCGKGVLATSLEIIQLWFLNPLTQGSSPGITSFRKSGSLLAYFSISCLMLGHWWTRHSTYAWGMCKFIANSCDMDYFLDSYMIFLMVKNSRFLRIYQSIGHHQLRFSCLETSLATFWFIQLPNNLPEYLSSSAEIQLSLNQFGHILIYSTAWALLLKTWILLNVSPLGSLSLMQYPLCYSVHAIVY